MSSDRLRALVDEDEHDQRAGTDAFAVLDLVLDRRLKRDLLTVVDTLGLDRDRRRSYVTLGAAPSHPGRGRHVRHPRPRLPGPERRPVGVLAPALARRDGRAARRRFDAVHPAGPARTVNPKLVSAPDAVRRQEEAPMALDFGLQIASFTGAGGSTEIARRLAAAARAGEDAGFTSVWIMDHFVQIPQAGRHWDEMLDGWTTVGFLAGHTTTATLGTLVTGVTYRNVAHLAKIAATLDVLCGGRAVCGIGAAWFEAKHRALRVRLPPLAERFRLLEDALKPLPLMWGAGRPDVRGFGHQRPRSHLLPTTSAGPHPDPGRRLGRAEDIATRRRVRQRVQPLRRHRDCPPQAQRAPRPLRRRGAGPGGDPGHPPRLDPRERRPDDHEASPAHDRSRYGRRPHRSIPRVRRGGGTDGDRAVSPRERPTPSSGSPR